ncbi:MAG: ABC transporter substrate-binding protein, partial [Betaproteobacteria bacterium]
MHTISFKRLLSILVAATACISADPAVAQPYPSRPVRMIVPYAAGGATDVVARQLSARLNEVLAQP